MAQPKRMSICLSAKSAEELEFLSDAQGTTNVEALRRAIMTEYYFHQAQREGSQIIIEDKDGQRKEVVFR